MSRRRFGSGGLPSRVWLGAEAKAVCRDMVFWSWGFRWHELCAFFFLFFLPSYLQ